MCTYSHTDRHEYIQFKSKILIIIVLKKALQLCHLKKNVMKPLMAHYFYPSTQKVDTGELGALGQPWLHRKPEASLIYIVKTCFKVQVE